MFYVSRAYFLFLIFSASYSGSDLLNKQFVRNVVLQKIELNFREENWWITDVLKGQQLSSILEVIQFPDCLFVLMSCLELYRFAILSSDLFYHGVGRRGVQTIPFHVQTGVWGIEWKRGKEWKRFRFQHLQPQVWDTHSIWCSQVRIAIPNWAKIGDIFLWKKCSLI